MIEKNEIEKVWFIEDNKLKKENKIVSKIFYKGVEIPVLKTERNRFFQDFLFKDKNNEYWSMKILGIEFKNFIHATIDPTLLNRKEYCDNFIQSIPKIDLKGYFLTKVSNEQYFNLCELKYISQFYPEIYEQAKTCREHILDKNRKEYEEKNNKFEQEKKEKVKELNTKFKEQLKEIKKKIYKGENIEVINFEFYKDDKYENGITTQNCILYLAKQYGIKIPIATQGFINNRLTDYNFEKKTGYFKRTTNDRCSYSMVEYLDKLYESIKKEFKRQKLSER